MKFNLDLGWVALAAGVYAFWYWWYWCMKGKQPMPCIAIYPSPPECEIAPNLPFYLPRPPFLGPPKECLTSNCRAPPMCLMMPMCTEGSVPNPMGCNCVSLCDIAKGVIPTADLCPCNSKWNWCVKGCVPAASMMPDCVPAPLNCPP